MKNIFNDELHKLKDKGIHFSFQRMKIFEYLIQNKNHPTVEKIYEDLLKEIPTLSKTTIYNTLKILEKAGSIKELPVEGHESRYDILTEDHGHFKCETCEVIFDFNINMDSLRTKGLENFKIYDRNVYFKGICLDCLSNIKKEDKGG